MVKYIYDGNAQSESEFAGSLNKEIIVKLLNARLTQNIEFENT